MMVGKSNFLFSNAPFEGTFVHFRTAPYFLEPFFPTHQVTLSQPRSTQSRCVVFSLIGVALALVAYVYARLCCQEDERKHHLGPCNPEGGVRQGSEGEGSSDVGCTLQK